MTRPFALSVEAEGMIPFFDSLSATDRLGISRYLKLSVEGDLETGTEVGNRSALLVFGSESVDILEVEDEKW